MGIKSVRKIETGLKRGEWLPRYSRFKVVGCVGMKTEKTKIFRYRVSELSDKDRSNRSSKVVMKESENILGFDNTGNSSTSFANKLALNSYLSSRLSEQNMETGIFSLKNTPHNASMLNRIA